MVDNMWRAHRHLPGGDRRRTLQGMISAWRRAAALQWASRELKQACREERKAWFEAHIQQAEIAASKHDIGAVYRVINKLAPRKQREKVRIRGTAGELLSPAAEFAEIYEYFRTAFSLKGPDAPALLCDPISHNATVLENVILQLKSGKAVPPTSLPAEVRKQCSSELAVFLANQLNSRATSSQLFPQEITDCTLSLLPKPNKPGKRPADLRPLGLQDPSAKIVATVVRDQLQAHTLQYLRDRPQYAYTRGKP